mmetsp:Transcript_11233/g.30827  ORF Transcript_11233/g.30827 Transcript_11233/m.30827 type:complete len:169 (-) Transcript_11233:100-606(-)
MAAAGAGGAGGPQDIDISNVPMQQLQQMAEQMEREDRALASNYNQLRMVMDRFKESKLALEGLSPEMTGKTILVPLTQSLYVPGKIADAERVLVDVGTGYYMNKEVAGAAKYFDKKVELLKTNTESLAKTISNRRQNLVTVKSVLQQRQQEAAAAAAGGGAAGGGDDA